MPTRSQDNEGNRARESVTVNKVGRVVLLDCFGPINMWGS
jgi:hypothetical protein